MNKALAWKVRKSLQKFFENGDCWLVFSFAFIIDRGTIMSEVIFKGAAADELSSKIRISTILENTVAFDNVWMA